MEGLGSPSCDSGSYMMPDLCLKVQRKREFMNFQNESPKSGKTQDYAGVDTPGLVVRGSVRIVASVASQRYHFLGPDLQPHDLAQWRILRTKVNARHEARREQYRFRKDPVEYLAALEEKFYQQTMRS
jgi:hypothetical protein